jgi:hypothetical protein
MSPAAFVTIPNAVRADSRRLAVGVVADADAMRAVVDSR